MVSWTNKENVKQFQALCPLPAVCPPHMEIKGPVMPEREGWRSDHSAEKESFEPHFHQKSHSQGDKWDCYPFGEKMITLGALKKTFRGFKSSESF